MYKQYWDAAVPGSKPAGQTLLVPRGVATWDALSQYVHTLDLKETLTRDLWTTL